MYGYLSNRGSLLENCLPFHKGGATFYAQICFDFGLICFQYARMAVSLSHRNKMTNRHCFFRRMSCRVNILSDIVAPKHYRAQLTRQTRGRGTVRGLQMLCSLVLLVLRRDLFHTPIFTTTDAAERCRSHLITEYIKKDPHTTATNEHIQISLVKKVILLWHNYSQLITK